MFLLQGGGLLVVALQVGCAVHAVKNNRMNWLWLILMFPFVGSLVYLIVEVRPHAEGRKVAARLAPVIAPGRHLQEMRDRFEACKTIQTRTALADECLRQGRHDEAIELYRAGLDGVFSDDPHLREGLAGAYYAKGALAEAREI